MMLLILLAAMTFTMALAGSRQEPSSEDESICALQVTQQHSLTAKVTPDDSTTLRGGTWCEINAVVPNGTLLTVIACQTGPNIPGPQVTDCCPIDTWTQLSFGGLASGVGTPMDVFMTNTHPSDADNGHYTEYEIDGQKKLLWDVQDACASSDVHTMPADLVCTNFSSTMSEAGRNANCMYFKDHGYNVLPEGGLQRYVDSFTQQYPYRTYMQGKYQPIMKTSSGSVYILQSHPTTNLTTGQPYFGTQQVGDDGKSTCEWITTCCGGLPEGWTLECGLLKANATCGASCTGNSVTTDDASGTWCLTDGGAEVE